MNFQDEAWVRWSAEPYPPILTTAAWQQEYGTDAEPHSSLWCASLATSLGDRFREDMSLLDYGCGGARFANFMSKRLANFSYIGVEPECARPSAAGLAGPTNIELCQQHFGHDRRVKFGAIGSSVERDALDCVDGILAGSIFTHLEIGEVATVFRRFGPAIQRGALFGFSIFFGPEYSLNGDRQAHGVEGCWSWVVHTRSSLDAIATEVGCKLFAADTFLAGPFLHEIIVASRL